MAMRFMERHLVNLKMYAKELNNLSKKCAKEEAKEKAKCKLAIQKGTLEKARIHGENAIRQKNQGLNVLRLSARVDAIASRVQSALANRKVVGSLDGVCRAMESAMRTLNLQTIATCLDKFETQFENLDVQSSFADSAMSQTTTTSVPVNDVNNLLHSVADEAGLDLQLDLPGGSHEAIAGTSAAPADDEDLIASLARLRTK